MADINHRLLNSLVSCPVEIISPPTAVVVPLVRWKESTLSQRETDHKPDDI